MELIQGSKQVQQKYLAFVHTEQESRRLQSLLRYPSYAHTLPFSIVASPQRDQKLVELPRLNCRLFVPFVVRFRGCSPRIQ